MPRVAAMLVVALGAGVWVAVVAYHHSVAEWIAVLVAAAAGGALTLVAYSRPLPGRGATLALIAVAAFVGTLAANGS